MVGLRCFGAVSVHMVLEILSGLKEVQWNWLKEEFGGEPTGPSRKLGMRRKWIIQQDNELTQ